YAARWSTETRGNVTSTNANRNAHTVNNQTGDSGRLQWISLGHARSSEIDAALDQTRFTDLFKLEPVTDGRCPTGSRPFLNANIINTRYWRTDVPSVELECLRLFDVRMKSVDSAHFRRVASRLESRRYAAHLGATIDFHKMEGIAHDNRHEKLYVAFASLSGGMLPINAGDAGYHHRDEIDHIRLPQAQRCGGIYALQLKADQTDSDGRPMDSAYVAVNMRPELLGRSSANGVNDCDPNTIAGPDNLTFIPGADLLIVAEDNDDIFRNDMVWTYRVSDPKPESAERKLTRIASVPYGAEATSTYFYDNYHGYAYLMVVAQKPYGKTLSRYADRMRTGAVQFPPQLRGEYRELYELLQKPIPEEYKGAIIGTIGPIPVASLPAMPEDAP
ncbi:MAG: hypothetical protein KDK34_12550, partial [Leptospiraceae bacterium]|nr:hypothetical protein [Leptospiraceae bacterium]